jgi:hypothetical protein
MVCHDQPPRGRLKSAHMLPQPDLQLANHVRLTRNASSKQSRREQGDTTELRRNDHCRPTPRRIVATNSIYQQRYKRVGSHESRKITHVSPEFRDDVCEAHLGIVPNLVAGSTNTQHDLEVPTCREALAAPVDEKRRI